ncbi:DUF637 domain-containing protein (plasmid) [Acinetobacter sp. ESL0695]|uniref:two-partner secretion domain-containing protein n=1 Tax=Acinetobacter sp. ESL0695 TaxID=2983215 RepID=UPI0023F56A0D|nr:DUF637 domain-containing protein [Acinetobacter sp. ESL0695]WEV50190.1 DUF637 domain-containing protein [Acinetobacter sp. ESL0695]
MNKNCYRIIYSKARQLFIAVAENIKSQTKTSGQSQGSTTEQTEQSFHEMWQVKALVISMSLWMPLSSVYAGIVADSDANVSNRPVIGIGRDSQNQIVPVINIQTPNGNGVSHNVYKELDVPTQGAVLNNSRGSAGSSIVGSVGANPYLQKGEARIILNEVNSTRASKIEGNIEVAGQQANLVIANPSGIDVRGGGFINANNVSLTTGRPQQNTDGSVSYFLVDQGKISISAKDGSNLGLGGANNNANYIDIYAQALELNAQLHANQDIQVITGNNIFDANSRYITNNGTRSNSASSLAIDVKNLGGMYANNIFLLGTEKGLGVSNTGTIRAINNLTVTSAGKIENSGRLESTSNTDGSLYIETTQSGEQGNINNSGSIASQSTISITSSNDFNMRGNQTLSNSNAEIRNSAQGNITYAENAQILSSGEINTIASKSLDIRNGTRTTANKDVNLISSQNLTVSNANLTSSSRNINLASKGSTESEGNIGLQGATLDAQGTVNVSALNGTLTASNLKANAQQDRLILSASKDMTITDESILKGNQGVTVATLGTGNLAVQNTTLESQNAGVIVTSNSKNTLDNNTLTAKGNIELFAKDNLTLNGTKSSSQQHTALNSKKNIYINSQANVDDSTNFNSNQISELTSVGILSLVSQNNQNLQNTKLTGGAVLIESGSALNTPTSIEINATGSNLLKNDAKLNVLNGDLSIQTQSSLTIDPNIYNINATGNIQLTSKQGTLTLAGYGGTSGNISGKVFNLTTNGGSISLQGESVDIQGSQLNASKDIKMVATNGDLKIDGVKNTINNSESKYFINYLKNKKEDLKIKLDNIYKNQEYMSRKDSLAKNLDRERIRAKGRVTSQNDDFCSAQCKEARQNVVILEKEYNNLVQKEMSLNNELSSVDQAIGYFGNTLNGYEHTESSISSNSGNISLTSNKGISISGANILAQTGQVNIEAQGTLGQIYSSTAQKGANGKTTQMGAGIIIDGHNNFYDKGNENDANYNMRTLISPSIITGNNGIIIRTTGQSLQDNLVLQATGIRSPNGDIRIESNKNILFDAAIEQSYDRTTSNEKRRSWGGMKKKYITTVSESNQADAVSVDISGKNIFIESKEKNSTNNIDIYSGKLTANGGQVSITSGGNINLYTVQESSSSNVDVTKKSSFAGIKYNSSKTNLTRKQINELPGILKADYIGVKADNDIRLVGTEFEYLQGAKIEAGRGLYLLTASNTVSETLKKERNSVVWQSMQDKGSVNETAHLPRFNGLTAPEFKANGGLIVQIPIGEKDQNKVELRDQILKLANQPGNDYLKDLVNRNDVDWQKVILSQKDWDYKSQGLTGAGAALLAIIVMVATSGAGVGFIGTTTAVSGGSVTTFGGITLATTTAGITTTTAAGAMFNAAVTSIATNASVSLVNNGGNIGKTLKDLGSQNSVKGLVASVATAGLLSQVSAVLNLKPDSSLLSDRLINNFTTSVSSTLVQTAINGGSLEDNLQLALLSGLAGALQGQLASEIGTHLDKVNPTILEYTIHKIAHAAAGCAVAAATKQSCEAAAIGAGVGEIVSSLMPPKSGMLYTDEEKQKVLIAGQLTAGVIAAYAGYDVNTASNSANIALINNSFDEKKVKKVLEQAKSYLGEKGGAALDAVSRGIAKGDIESLKNVQASIAEYLLKKAESGGLSQEEVAVFGTLYALNETLFPTNILDVIPGAGKGISKGNDLLRIVKTTAPSSAVSATARLALREDLAKLANIPRNMEVQPANIWGKSSSDIRYSFEMDGATLSLVPPRASSSGLAEVYDIHNSATGIKQIEIHAGGGTHTKQGDRYYKIVMSDGTQIRIIDPNGTFSPGTITSNQIYLNPQGQKLKYENGKWGVWK